jgi:hypothetical protein
VGSARSLEAFGGVLGRIVGILGGFARGPWGWIFASLDNAKSSGPTGISWTAAMQSGMTSSDIKEYIHRIGWPNASPDMREHWTERQEQTNNVHQVFNLTLAPGTTNAQARQIIDLGMKGLRSHIRAHGELFTNKDSPGSYTSRVQV